MGTYGQPSSLPLQNPKNFAPPKIEFLGVVFQKCHVFVFYFQFCHPPPRAPEPAPLITPNLLNKFGLGLDPEPPTPKIPKSELEKIITLETLKNRIPKNC